MKKQYARPEVSVMGTLAQETKWGRRRGGGKRYGPGDWIIYTDQPTIDGCERHRNCEDASA